MTREELSTHTHNWITLCTAPINWALFDKLHADNFQDMSPGGRQNSKEAFADGIKNLIEAFPDIKTKVEDLIIDESIQRVAVRWSATGTNKMKYLGVGPTDKSTKITGIEIIEFESGKIIKRWGEWDISGHGQR